MMNDIGKDLYIFQMIYSFLQNNHFISINIPMDLMDIITYYWGQSEWQSVTTMYDWSEPEPEQAWVQQSEV